MVHYARKFWSGAFCLWLLGSGLAAWGADRTYVVAPARLVGTGIPSPVPAALTSKLASITTQITTVLKGHDYVATAPADAAAAYGANADFIVVPTVTATFAAPAPGKTAPPPALVLNITMQSGDTFATVGSVSGIDVSARSDAKMVLASEVLAIFQNQKAPRHPAIVVYNEGSRDQRTANTAFSGPAYVEARLIEGLAYQRLDTMAASEFLSSNGNATILTGTSDDILAHICAVDPSVHVLSYIIIYEQTANPLFGTQNAAAHLHGNFRNCGAADILKLDEDGRASWIGNKGLLFSQYFQVLNFVLSAGRRNKNYIGILGKEGTIASALLPDVPSTAAVQTAVGDAARRMSCRVSLAFFAQDRAFENLTELDQNYVRDLINRRNEPCVANDVVKRSTAVRRQARESDASLYHLAPAPSASPSPSQ